MFAINKNGTKHKIGIIMPAFFPASRTTYDNTTSGLSATKVQDAIDELAGIKVKKYLRDIGGLSLSALSSGVHYGVVVPSALTSHHVIGVGYAGAFYGDLEFVPYEDENGTNPGIVVYSASRTAVPSGVKVNIYYI